MFKMYETDTGLLQAPSRCQMRTEEMSTDAEREMMSKIEIESRWKMSGRESADTSGIADAMHREKKKYPCTYSDGMNARKVGRIVPDGRGRSVCP